MFLTVKYLPVCLGVNPRIALLTCFCAFLLCLIRLISACWEATWTPKMGMERSIYGSLNGNSLKQRFLVQSRSTSHYIHLLTLFPKFFISDSNYYKLSHQAVAYYYHGLILDKGNEPSCNVSAACCFLAAEELLSESKKACLNFCLAAPVTRFGLIRLLYMGHRSLAILHGIMLGETFFQGFSTRGIYEAFTSENS